MAALTVGDIAPTSRWWFQSHDVSWWMSHYPQTAPVTPLTAPRLKEETTAEPSVALILKSSSIVLSTGKRSLVGLKSKITFRLSWLMVYRYWLGESECVQLSPEGTDHCVSIINPAFECVHGGCIHCADGWVTRDVQKRTSVLQNIGFFDNIKKTAEGTSWVRGEL